MNKANGLRFYHRGAAATGRFSHKRTHRSQRFLIFFFAFLAFSRG